MIWQNQIFDWLPFKMDLDYLFRMEEVHMYLLQVGIVPAGLAKDGTGPGHAVSTAVLGFVRSPPWGPVSTIFFRKSPPSPPRSWKNSHNNKRLRRVTVNRWNLKHVTVETTRFATPTFAFMLNLS